MYITGMSSIPAERKVLLVEAGGARLALRIGLVREITSVPGDGSEVLVRGSVLPVLPLAAALGLRGGPPRYAVVADAVAPLALGVDALHGILDLSEAEVFQLPARTSLPAPPPFVGAIVWGQALSLELAAGDPRNARHRAEVMKPPPLVGRAGPEITFLRGSRAFAVPVELVIRVVEAPRVFAVPLTPPAHRGLLYYGRAIHPVFDLPVLFGGPTSSAMPGTALPGTALLVEAGEDAIAVLADRIVASTELSGEEVTRPSWDLLFAGRERSEEPGKS